MCDLLARVNQDLCFDIKLEAVIATAAVTDVLPTTNVTTLGMMSIAVAIDSNGWLSFLLLPLLLSLFPFTLSFILLSPFLF